MSNEVASQADRRPDAKGAAGELLRLVGVLLLGADILINWGFAVPAPGYEWLNRGELAIAAVTLIVGSTLLLGSSSESQPRTRLMSWIVVILGVVSILSFAFKHTIGAQ